MSTLEGTTMHPRCRHMGACWDLLEWFQLFGTSQNSISNLKKKQVQIQFRFFLNQIIMFPCSSTLKDLSIDVSNTNVGLILTKLRRFQLFVKIRISNFFEKKNHINFGFPCCSTCEDLSIDVSITIVGLILTKLRWFQLFVKSQNSNFELFWKKNQIFGSPCCSTREDLSIDVSITNAGLILTKLRWFQLFVKSQNSNFELIWKKFKFLSFHGVVLVKTFPLMYQLLL